MNDLKILERLNTVQNFADEHLDAWPKWKKDIILKKIDCLMEIMESKGRRAYDIG